MTYGPWEALGAAILALYPYFIFTILIAAAIAFLAVLFGTIQTEEGEEAPKGLRVRFSRHFLEVSVYCGAYALFGMVTSFFLAQGLTDDGHRVSNPLFANFVTPFVALLTGGVTFVASKTRLRTFKNDVVLGVICFLITCLLSYEAMKRDAYGSDHRADRNVPEATSLTNDNGFAPAPPPPAGMENEVSADENAASSQQ